MLELDDAKVTIADAAGIAKKLKPVTVYSWVNNDWLRLRGKDKPAKVPGATTFLSGRRLMQLAIAAELVALGAHPELACAAAYNFTDLSDPLEAPGFHRDPGRLFDNSFTYLAAYPDGDVKIIRAAGVEVPRRDKATGKRGKVIAKPSIDDVLIGTGKREGCWLLPLDFIVKHVENALREINRDNT